MESGWWVFHNNDEEQAGDVSQDEEEKLSRTSNEQNNWSLKEKRQGKHSTSNEDKSNRAPGLACDSFNFLVPALSGDFPVSREMKKKLDFSKKRSWKPIVSLDCGSREDPKPHRIRLMCWNIEGLNPEKLEERTLALCKNILQDDPNVVFLQEVLAFTQKTILEKLPMYYFIPSNVCTYYNSILFNQTKYYTAIMVKKECAVLHEYKVIDIPTRMGRNILLVKCTIKGEKFCIMTSHLESTGHESSTRKKQLKKAFNLMKEVEPDHTVIFGGDLNLRDHELHEIGGIPADIYDIWEITGRRGDAQFTWDMQCNDNLVFSSSSGDIRPRKRYDRLYIRHSIPMAVEPVYFELIGFDRLKCGKFCSDHWGLLTHIDIISKVKSKRSGDKKKGENTSRFKKTY